MTELLLESLHSFPPLRESINSIKSICSHRDTDIKALSRVIESDPQLYAELLRSVNAPFYSFKNEIKSVSQAISLFGVSLVRGFCLAIAIKKHTYTDLSAYNITSEQWIATMQKQQQFLYLWLSKENPEALAHLGALSFILEIGRLVSAYTLIFSENSYHFTQTDPDKLILEEIKILDSSGDTLAARLFEFWYYEPDFINLFEHSLSPHEAENPKEAAMLYIARHLFTLKETNSLDSVAPIIKEFQFNESVILESYKSLV